MPTSRDSESEDKEPEMTESEYEDLVWLTKKAVRSKLDKWRKDVSEQEKPIPQIEQKDIVKSCRTCYFGSSCREVNKIWYVKCSLEEPRWTVVEDNLPCWKIKE